MPPATVFRQFISAILLVFVCQSLNLQAQTWIEPDDGRNTNRSMFRPIDEWPDPNEYRNASGAPGYRYWQQRADYVIEARLDTNSHRIHGSERITYHNNSPEPLGFIWVQLDQNVRSIEHSRTYQMRGALPQNISPRARRFIQPVPFDGGYNISRVQLVDDNGELVDADYRIRNTVMKINLLKPIGTGEQVQFDIDWDFIMPDNGRGAKEHVNDGWMYDVAQWFPRMSVYDDVNGWQTDQFLGRGEFYLNFGDYDVKLTVPYDHIVDATGILQNPDEVLTAEQRSRLEKAYQGMEPTFIVRPDEVGTPGIRPTDSGTLTWHFKAENVRDFAWVSSAAYVWDAAGYKYETDEEPIAVHSIYPRVGMPLWDKVSTRATIQTLVTYGRMSLKYPYPKAVNAHGPVGGMEYPMIAFCGARPNPDGSYSEGLERGLISVTIHEVGHNWFPMIVASDERRWTWMDEGLNTFLQYYAEQDYAQRWTGTPIGEQFIDGKYSSRRGPASLIVPYMQDPDQVPIMTQSDLIHKDFGPNGYAKPATGLQMLRENILDPEIFDEAFREYSQRWAFKQPQPADFFRSMEDAAGEDLSYFWRGWFYTTNANDQAVGAVTDQAAEELIGNTDQGEYYYRIQINNEGGLVLPVDMQLTYEDGSIEMVRMPADVWRNNERTFVKGLFTQNKVVKVEIDPNEVFADIDRSDNVWEIVPVDESERGEQ